MKAKNQKSEGEKYGNRKRKPKRTPNPSNRKNERRRKGKQHRKY
jgi:hypothetical protein